jgi:hypothetical protein
LIMVLSFTGAISAATDAKEEIKELLWAALGCNVAWGFVDAIMYLLNILMERGHGLKVISKITTTDNPSENRETLRSEIQPVIASLHSCFQRLIFYPHSKSFCWSLFVPCPSPCPSEFLRVFRLPCVFQTRSHCCFCLLAAIN